MLTDEEFDAYKLALESFCEEAEKDIKNISEEHTDDFKKKKKLQLYFKYSDIIERRYKRDIKKLTKTEFEGQAGLVMHGIKMDNSAKISSYLDL
jgi:hypothetical protein